MLTVENEMQTGVKTFASLPLTTKEGLPFFCRLELLANP
jgi:hypothetical protein